MKHVHFPQLDDEAALKRLEADLIICRPGDWDARPERHDPAWTVVRDGAKLFCLKISGPDRAHAPEGSQRNKPAAALKQPARDPRLWVAKGSV